MPPIEQWVYIDESGSAGLKSLTEPQQVFAMAAVIFDNAADIESTVAAMGSLRRRLGKPAHFEFRCAHASPRLRRDFMEAVRDCSFRVRALIVPKSVIASGRGGRSSGTSVYRATLAELLAQEDSLRNAKVFLDRCGGHRTRVQLMTDLRKHLNSPAHRAVGDFRFASKANDLIQLADMVVGVIARDYCQLPGAAECRALLGPRIVSVSILGTADGG